MKPHCADCGDAIEETDTACPNCGVALHDGNPVLSYIGSALILIAALLFFLPTEEYAIWYGTGTVLVLTGLITLPPVKLYLRDYDIHISRGVSWFISLVGVGISIALVPT